MVFQKNIIKITNDNELIFLQAQSNDHKNDHRNDHRNDYSNDHRQEYNVLNILEKKMKQKLYLEIEIYQFVLFILFRFLFHIIKTIK